MRKRCKNNGVSVHAIAGTNVVILGLGVYQKKVREGLLGFAVHREDKSENEQYFLRGFKTFKETEPYPWPGSHFSTREHPIQTLLWGDYTAKPNHTYVYTIIPLKGKPTNLVEHEGVSVEVTTEKLFDEFHGVYFNRAMAASQAYSRKFGEANPDQVPCHEACKWLARELEDEMVKFIRLGTGNGNGLRAAIYEFYYPPILDEFRYAHDNGGDVEIIYDARDPDVRKNNENAISQAGIEAICHPRDINPSYTAHNKFIILIRNRTPTCVWTGSTNITESHFYGHANLAHVVKSEELSSAFLKYWEKLRTNPTGRELRPWIETENPIPSKLEDNSFHAFFSPRKSLEILEWYTNLMEEIETKASSCVCISAPFGVKEALKEFFVKDKDYLRYILLEQRGGVSLFSRDPDNRVSYGASIPNYRLDRWMTEDVQYGHHVKYIHTKFILIDPLGKQPVVVTGSANFSKNSTKDNDENSVVIKGSQRVADIYLGEFMRLFNHYYFRSVLSRMKKPSDSEERRRTYLVTNNSWLDGYYGSSTKDPDPLKVKQRKLFG